MQYTQRRKKHCSENASKKDRLKKKQQQNCSDNSASKKYYELDRQNDEFIMLDSELLIKKFPSNELRLSVTTRYMHHSKL